MSGTDSLNVYITIALVVGIIAVLAVSFYYEFQLSHGEPNDKMVVPVVTVTATKIVIVTQSVVNTCSSNQTSGGNQTSTC